MIDTFWCVSHRLEPCCADDQEASLSEGTRWNSMKTSCSILTPLVTLFQHPGLLLLLLCLLLLLWCEKKLKNPASVAGALQLSVMNAQQSRRVLE